MPPRLFSRHSFTFGILDECERLFLTDRVPFGFRALSDNRTHTVQEGDTLYNLAGRFFLPKPRPAGLWWIIADFQPDPIHDPTIPLDLGRAMFIPSIRTVDELILSERRRREING